MQNDHRLRTLIQSSPVLLEGHRNSIDGCWDIPVRKTVLQQNNYKKPLTHSGLYANRQNKLNSAITLLGRNKGKYTSFGTLCGQTRKETRKKIECTRKLPGTWQK